MKCEARGRDIGETERGEIGVSPSRAQGKGDREGYVVKRENKMFKQMGCK